MARSLKEILAEHEARKAREEAAKNAKPAEVPSQAQSAAPPVATQPAKKGFLSRVKAAPVEPEAVQPSESKPAVAPVSVEKPAASVQLVVPVAAATAPPKTDLKDADISSLRRNLDYLAEHIEHKELVGQVVRNIAAQLQENPQFSSQMQPHDFNLIVRGLRKAFNTAARKKSEGVAKKKASDDETSEIMALLKGAGIGLG